MPFTRQVLRREGVSRSRDSALDPHSLHFAFHFIGVVKFCLTSIHQLPSKGNVNVRFDDGSGTVISAPPGRTAFIVSSTMFSLVLSLRLLTGAILQDAVKMYESFSDEDKAWVQHSTIEYAPS